MRTTFADVKNSRIPASLGVCPGDAVFAQWVNEAQQRLLIEGKWYGTYAKFNICATNACITLPPQIATIESAAICHQPVPVHDQWFEFLENGAGTRDAQSCWQEANSRGWVCTFTDIVGTNKKLKFACDLTTDVGKKVLALGYDQNGNWIRTLQSGVYADGELITLAQSPGTTSTNFFSNVTDLQFTAMDGQSWLYEYNVDTTELRMLGHYQYSERRPSYARYFFPSLHNASCNGSSCNTVMVEVMAKLEYFPVVADTDYMIISNIPALKEMCVAIKNAERESDGVRANQIIAAGLATAKNLLDKELDHYLGTGRRIGIELVGSSIGQVCPIENFI